METKLISDSFSNLLIFWRVAILLEPERLWPTPELIEGRRNPIGGSRTMLTCKSLVRVGRSGERPIEQSSSWLLLKFPPGKQILFVYVVLCGKANELLVLEIYIIFTNISNFKYAIKCMHMVITFFTILGFSGSCYGKQNRQCGINR